MEAHGDEDMVAEPTDQQMEQALEEVVEAVMDYGQWPVRGRARFDLYEHLLENRDPSYAWEMYVAAMSCNMDALAERIERERKRVETLLTENLRDADIVYDRAVENAE